MFRHCAEAVSACAVLKSSARQLDFAIRVSTMASERNLNEPQSCL